MWMLVAVALAGEEPTGEPTEAPDPAPEVVDEVTAAALARRDRIDGRNAARAARIFGQRALANHPFITPQFARSALPTSHAATRFGGAVVYAPYAADGSPGGLWGAVGGGLEAAVRFGKWAGLRAELGGLAGLQTAAGEVPQIAAEAGWDVSGGVPIRVLHARSTALTIEPTGGYFDSTELAVTETLLDLGDQALGGEGVDVDETTARMVTRTQGGGAGAALSLAQAAGKVFGLQVSAGAEYQAVALRFTDERGEQEIRASQVDVDAGLALSLDANPVPLAVMLEYAFGASVGVGDLAGVTALQHQVGLGIYLNGLTNTVGIEAFGRLTDTTLSAGAQVALRAYF